MAQFFFNLVSPGRFETDEIGCELPDIEAAYLEGRMAAVEISAEMLRNHCDPTRHQFEIVDDQGRFLMELPFSEVLWPRATAASHAEIRPKLRAAIQRGQKLRGEIREELKKSRTALAASRAVMARSRTD